MQHFAHKIAICVLDNPLEPTVKHLGIGRYNFFCYICEVRN